VGKFISFLLVTYKKVAIKGTYGYEEMEELEESSSLLVEVWKLSSASSSATSTVAVLCHVMEGLKRRLTW
jgi:hypothetical protein